VAHGFTLIELLVAVSVLAIIMTFAIPGFQNIINGNRAATMANEVVTALAYGRSEATRRGAAVTVCSSSDQATCSGSANWAAGWIVRDSNNNLLRAWGALAGTATLVGPATIVFRGDGSVDPAPASNFCLTVSAAHVRTVEVNRVGRVRTERAAC